MRRTQRLDQLKHLTPLEATRLWLEGDFESEEQPALLAAIRQDRRISFSDDEIIDLFTEAMREEEVEAPEFLGRLERAA